jgi:pimeloyl-ACP methyl ester carboxylesterase
VSARALTDVVQAWRDGGELVHVGGRQLFVRDFDGAGPPLLFLHGYPSSSYDWQPACGLLRGRRMTTVRPARRTPE